MTSILVVGSGPSVMLVDWQDERGPVAAISSGITHCPRADHFFSMDGGSLFPDVPEGTIKHTSQHTNWDDVPNVRRWNVIENTYPLFEGDDVADGALLWKFRGEGHREGLSQHSMLLAVQILPRLGFDTLEFIGCDMTSGEHAFILDVLQQWHHHAKAQGITWLNRSPLSMLQAFVPNAERMTAL